MASRYDPYGIWVWSGIALIFVAGIVLQSTVYLNHDAGWVLRTAGWLLDGREFGRDIVDPSPPLIWYLSIPPAALICWIGLSEPTVFRAYTFLIAALTLVLCWRLLRPYRADGSRAAAGTIMLALTFVVLVGPGRDFGQREYFAVLLGMPYLLLVAGRLQLYSFGRWLEVVTGIAAGLAFSLKPYFLVVPILIEAHQLLRAGRPSAVVRAETVTMAAVSGAYGASMAVLAPAYLTDVLPLLLAVYSALDRPLLELLPRLQENHQVGILFLCLAFMVGRRPSSYEIVLGLSAVGFLAAYLVQMKGWTYHGFPFFSVLFVFACLACAMGWPVAGASTFRRFGGTALIVLFTWIQLARITDWYGLHNTRSGPLAYQVTQVISAVEKYAGGGAFYAFSTHPYPGFPTANYTSARWIGRYNSQFIVPAIVRQQSTRLPASERLVEAEAYLRASVLADFRNDPPAVVLVDIREERHGIGVSTFDHVAFYTQDPRFAELWSSYVEIEVVAGFRIFRQRS